MIFKFEHHEASLKRAVEHFAKDGEVLALILGGSIAHGYATSSSDIDLMILVSAGDYKTREIEGRLLFYDEGLCDYPGGYIDGKYIDRGYLELVGERGNESTRYAFKDAEIVHGGSPELEALVKSAAVFDRATKTERGRRFYAHMHAWKWYFNEAIRQGNELLRMTALSNFILYACRSVLNHNEMLYPYHKWLLAEVGRAREKPEGFLTKVSDLVREGDAEGVEELAKEIKAMKDWGLGDWDWPHYFVEDVEKSWMRQEPYIADL
ncbi:MAG TPA: nucleotidyltransferase domain-containing protein [Rectinemataceae bacterium]|nr:nucleotidyltransferase domain-containing protein [Rectinemataceae bacterium]